MNNTSKAILRRAEYGEDRFFLGKYFYKIDIDGVVRRREQKTGRTPTTDWETVTTIEVLEKEMYA